MLDLYRDEKQDMVEKSILDRVFLALSREQNVPKVWCYQQYSDIISFLFSFQKRVFVSIDKICTLKEFGSQNRDKKNSHFMHSNPTNHIFIMVIVLFSYMKHTHSLDLCTRLSREGS